VKYRISHVTRYRYSEPVSLCHNQAHLKPRSHKGQAVSRDQIKIEPWPAVSREHRDFFGNRVNYFSIQQAHEVLEVTALSEVEVTPAALPPGHATPAWEAVRDQLRQNREQTGLHARLFALESPSAGFDADVREYATASFPPGRPLLEGARDLMGRIHGEFAYDPHFTTVATPLAEVMRHRRGVCQDFAHLAIACLRSLGLAARYVSGYLETLPPPGQSKLQGADASHAWFAIYLPRFGWVDFDPTNNQIPGEQHVTTALGRDYNDVTPLKGIFYGGGEHQLEVAVDMERVADQ
jgi:transglutaminase-like putative cysteine protease